MLKGRKVHPFLFFYPYTDNAHSNSKDVGQYNRAYKYLPPHGKSHSDNDTILSYKALKIKLELSIFPPIFARKKM